jgi:succinyl-CoA synthetase alpha subunit
MLPDSLSCRPSHALRAGGAGGKGKAGDKIAALEAAGVTVTNSPAQMGVIMRKVMQERGLL